MDIGKAFSFVFEDERWVSKVLIGGLVALIPIVNFALLGYMLRVAQNVAQGNPRPLPEWNEFGDHFMRGLYGIVIAIVYQLPTIILYVLFFCVLLGASGAASSESSDGAGAIGALGVCLFPLIFVLAIGGALLTYVAIARYLASNTLSEAFKFSEVISSFRSNLGAWVMLLLVGILANFVGGLGVIACGVGVLFTSFYAQCVMGHALGQTIRQLGGATQPPAPPSYGPPPTFQ